MIADGTDQRIAVLVRELDAARDARDDARSDVRELREELDQARLSGELLLEASVAVQRVWEVLAAHPDQHADGLYIDIRDALA